MKLKVHLIDDHNLFETSSNKPFLETTNNLKPLFIEDQVTLTNDIERIDLAENIFEFKHFYRVDEAIKYYDEGGEAVYPDLIIIDLSFDGLDDVQLAQAILYTWGVEMGEYAQLKFPHIPRIFLSCNHTNPHVAKRLEEKNITIDSLDLVRKSEPTHFKQRCATVLRSRAKAIFNQLNEFERNKFWLAIEQGIDIRNYQFTKNIHFDFRDVTLRSLLWGYGDIDRLGQEDACNIILDILQELEKDVEFKGIEWNKGYVRVMLKEYQVNHTDYYERRKHIDINALNLLLEILQIRQHYDGLSEIPLYKNFVPKLSYTCSERNAEKHTIFQHKMMGRRVATTFYMLFPNGDTVISSDILSSLLNRGVTYDEDAAPINTGTVMGTQLGLTTNAGKVVTTRKTILFEELEFYRTVGKYSLQVRDFLDYYDRSAFLVHKDEFIDFEAFNKAVNSIRLNYTRKYPSLLQHIKDTIDDHNPPLIHLIEYLLGIKLA